MDVAGTRPLASRRTPRASGRSGRRVVCRTTRARTTGRARRGGARARTASCQAETNRWPRRTDRSVRVSAASVSDRPSLASRTKVGAQRLCSCRHACDGNMTDRLVVACQPRDSRHESVYCVQPDRDACRAEIMHHGPVPRSSVCGRHVSLISGCVALSLFPPSLTFALPTPPTHTHSPFFPPLPSLHLGRPGRSASPLPGDPLPHLSSRFGELLSPPLLPHFGERRPYVACGLWGWFVAL